MSDGDIGRERGNGMTDEQPEALSDPRPTVALGNAPLPQREGCKILLAPLPLRERPMASRARRASSARGKSTENVSAAGRRSRDDSI